TAGDAGEAEPEPVALVEDLLGRAAGGGIARDSCRGVNTGAGVVTGRGPAGGIAGVAGAGAAVAAVMRDAADSRATLRVEVASRAGSQARQAAAGAGGLLAAGGGPGSARGASGLGT